MSSTLMSKSEEGSLFTEAAAQKSAEGEDDHDEIEDRRADGNEYHGKSLCTALGNICASRRLSTRGGLSRC